MQIWRLERPEDGLGPFEYGNKFMHESHPYEEKEQFGDTEAKALGWTRMVEDVGFDFFGGLRTFKQWEIPPDHPHHNDDTQPGGEPYHWKVGTKDEQQFLHWFPKTSFEFFTEHGFQLSLYECDPQYVHMGEYQLLFCVEDAKLLERKPLSDLSV
jgi:hypothetical protein